MALKLVNEKEKMDKIKKLDYKNKKLRISKLRLFNSLLVILILICSIVLIYRLSLKPEEHEFKVKLPTEGIINVHERIQRSSDTEKWLEVMDICGISATCMLASPEQTYLLNSPPGFSNYSKNNDLVIYLEHNYDSKILAFPTLDPRDPNALDIIKDQLDQGAIGFNSFSGHTAELFPPPKTKINDYLGPLDRSDMYPIYDYLEQNRISFNWHVKLKNDTLYTQVKEILSNYPNLIVDFPHFGVLGTDVIRLGELMDNYSGIYTDIAFGGYAKWGMPRVSDNIELFREFAKKYHDRVMFGTDIVITNNIRKTVSWLVNHTMAYRNMLEKDQYYVNIPNITGEGFDLNETLNGFGLSEEILNEIYFENPIRFLSGEPANIKIVSKQNSTFSRSNDYTIIYIPLKIICCKNNIKIWNLIILVTETKITKFS